MAMQTILQVDAVHPSAAFQPNIYDSTFLASFSLQDSEFESYTKEMEVLKEKVKQMLMKSAQEFAENIHFINLLYRLGVAYHFEDEIEEQLNHIFNALPSILSDKDYDLHTVALQFQILRLHRYNISCDVFEKFKNEDGEFKEKINNNVKGILSLYEATFLRVHGEDILEEALDFTRKLLETLAAKSSPHLAKQIRHALSQPVYRGMEILEARQYIFFYEEEEDRNETLLKFAKFNFNRLQLLYKHESGLLVRWWQEVNIIEKLQYTRDRLVEGCFWAFGSLFEPKYAKARENITKYGTIITCMDDTYDVYGTMDELQRLTLALQRCTVDAIDQLPEYMKALSMVFFNLFEEIEDDDGASYVKDTFKELVRSYFTEAKWFESGYVPLFEEYAENGLVSIGYNLTAASAFIGLESDVGIKEINWARTNPPIIRAALLLCRLMNDVAGHKDEYQRPGDCATSVQCYMKEHGVTKEIAVERIQEIFTNLWKDINEAYIDSTISKHVLKCIVGLARVAHFIYVDKDLYTNASSLKDSIALLLDEQLPL